MKSIKHIAGAGFGFLKVCASKTNPGFCQKSTTILLSPQGLYFLPTEKRDHTTATRL
jgi:hypothetical protein